MLSCLRRVVFLKNDVCFCKSPGIRCYPASGGSFFWKITFFFVKVLISGAILPPAGRFSEKNVSFLQKSWSPVLSCLRRVVFLKKTCFFFVKALVSGAILPPAGRFSGKLRFLLQKSWTPVLSCLRRVVFLKNDVCFCKSPGLRCYPASGG